jgi:hypothetical protein
VFFFEGIVNGEKQRWVAGDDNYFMFTQLGTSFSGSTQFEGALQSTTQANAHGLLIGLIGEHNGLPFSLEQWNTNSSKPLFTSQINTIPGRDLTLQLEPQFAPGETPTSLIWRIEGPNTVFTTVLNPIVEVDIDNYPVYQIRLSVTYASGCIDDIQQRIDFRNLAARDDFSVVATNAGQQQLERQYRYTTLGDSVVWWSGGTLLGVGTQIQVPFSPGVKQMLRMQVPLQNTEIAVVREFMPDAAGSPGCSSYFTFRVTPEPGVDFYKAAHVLLTYTNPNGKQFSSAWNPQATTIQLSDFQNFRANAAGQPTVRFKIAGDFYLTATDGTTVQFSEVSGYLGVAVGL